jgi:hypothetical protein
VTIRYLFRISPFPGYTTTYCREGCEREGCDNLGVNRQSISPYRSSTNRKLSIFHDIFFERIADPSPYAICRYHFGRHLLPRRASRPVPSREFGCRAGRFSWLMHLGQVWPGGSAKHLRLPSATLYSSEPPVWSRFWTIWRFPDQRGSNDGMRDGPETRQDGRFRR